MDRGKYLCAREWEVTAEDRCALAMERGEPLLYKGDDFVHAGLARVVG